MQNIWLILIILFFGFSISSQNSGGKVHDINDIRFTLPENLQADHSFIFKKKGVEKSSDEEGVRLDFEPFPESVSALDFAEDYKKKILKMKDARMTISDITSINSNYFEFKTLNTKIEKEGVLYFGTFRWKGFIGKLSFQSKSENEKEWVRILKSLKKFDGNKSSTSGFKILVAGEFSLELPDFYINQKEYTFSDSYYKGEGKINLVISEKEFDKNYEDSVYVGGINQKLIIKKLKIANLKNITDESSVELNLIENKNIISRIWVRKGNLKISKEKKLYILLKEIDSPDFGNQNWKKIIESIVIN